mmetsp:Transcript_30538/g.60436  ORF Transcript_30538/g.60436 Transcript_30538/m.60436 type:complete len:87 (-) Transcript_30538:1312-1572(-)
MACTIHDILLMIQWGWYHYYPMLFIAIGQTLRVELPYKTASVLPIVSLLMVVGLSMLRRRWHGGAAREQMERTNQHGAGGGLDQAV